MSKKTVIGIFNDAAEADAAIRDLESHGFKRDESRMLYSSGRGAAGGAGTAFDLKPDLEEKGVPESDAEYYMQCFRDGKPLVEVSVDEMDRAEQAAGILVDRGAQGPIREIGGTAGERKLEGEYPVTEAGKERLAAGVEHVERETHIPIVEEELKVGKRSVETGRTRIYSRVVEEPVSERINLREERTFVERRPADRPATEAELREAQGKVVEVHGTREEAVVEKEPRVVEEVVIKEEEREHPEEIKGKVRRTEVDIQQEPEKEK